MRIVGRALAAAVAVCIAAVPLGQAHADAQARSYGGAPEGSYEGSIDGAPYRIEVPEDWNGTLVLFSHGYYVADYLPEGVQLAAYASTERWLLARGYALAASEYKGRGPGYAVEDALVDQMALLRHFEKEVGKPRRTLSAGMSQGAAVAGQLAERYPGTFAGTAGMCSEVDTPGSWNTALDVLYVVKTLLAPDADVDLVRPADPETAAGDAAALAAAVSAARGTGEGRARLALAGAIANIPTAISPFEPAPADVAGRLDAQSAWIESAYAQGLGPTGRLDLEARAGGNPSWNTGIDYRAQLARAHPELRALVDEAYGAAPAADLDADLAALAGGERIGADRRAVAYTKRHGLVRGKTSTPTLTLHTTGDGGALADQVGTWAEQVESHRGAPFRQLYVGRGGHCSYTSAEEIVALLALDRKVATGRWGDLTPERLDAAVGSFGPEYQEAFDFGTGAARPVDPAFTEFTPPRFLRPTR
ncbi:hypothetical protein DMB38_20830 [Streptomyces sp. WAC 06738]|uniref:DUF6351 family protein n=1 Tax=Streptomyces sp. WAC 06738 TaxID=2203210 RepID=UPI000F701485|nr:DUF6351 family protein [Streptomyces sp. WAC 06738]AZM47911.1 hypothetical protein DMB38_20830 [Streptomyces sp. WAC 06738]